MSPKTTPRAPRTSARRAVSGPVPWAVASRVAVMTVRTGWQVDLELANSGRGTLRLPRAGCERVAGGRGGQALLQGVKRVRDDVAVDDADGAKGQGPGPGPPVPSLGRDGGGGGGESVCHGKGRGWAAGLP